MSCYSGGVDVFLLELDPWQPIECVYDSLEGNSPLMQLCRMVNRAQESAGLTKSPFHRVGVNPSDLAFASIDYSSNHNWSPLSDFDTILSQCASYVLSLLGPSITGSDCIARTFTNRVLILSGLPPLSSSLLGDLLREKFYNKILTVRQYLEALVGKQLTLHPWSVVPVSLFTTSPPAPSPAGAINVNYSTGRDASGDIIHDPSVYVGGHPALSCKYFTVPLETPYQILENVSFGGNIIQPSQLSSRYGVGINCDTRTSEGDDLDVQEFLYYCGLETDSLLHHLNFPTWTKVKKYTHRQYFKISASMPVGQTFFWSSSIVKPNVDCRLSPSRFVGGSSGAITVNSSNRASLLAGTFYRDITIELIEEDLDLSIQLKDPSWMGDWGNTFYGAIVEVSVLEGSRILCRDACGNYHSED